jgi:predicted ABC-type ATPase
MIQKLNAILGGDQPIFFLLAGPNGAGKSTFRKKFLDPIPFNCIDPDAVAREIYGRDPDSPDEARGATIASTARVRQAFAQGESVGLETVFSDSNGFKLKLIEEAQSHGFRAGVIFIGLDGPELSVARVMDRVENGGHDVPDDLIHRRFPRCFQNLKAALKISDFVLLVDNSQALRHRIFGASIDGSSVQLWDPPPRWYTSFVA